MNTFIEVGSIGLRRSARLQHQVEGRPSTSKGALCRATKAICLVAIQVSAITTAGAHAVHH